MSSAVRDRRSFPLLETITGTDRRRFFLKYQRNEGNQCWLWTGGTIISRLGEKYGYFRLGKEMWLAHRVQYFLTTGIDPGEKEVCHSCDVTLCVNPKHLWLGTSRENKGDSLEKGRKPSGVNCSQAKLTLEQVKMIRESPEQGRVLAKRFSVTPSAICDIRCGRNWKQF